MTCQHIRRDIPALIDGDLRPRRREEVCHHLTTCPACAEERDAIESLLVIGDCALQYHGAPLSFRALQADMKTVDPLEQVIRYQLPPLKIPGTVPRFAVAMILLLVAAGPLYAYRHTRQVYTAVQTPFISQEATLMAALEDGEFPWDKQDEPTEEDEQV